MMKIIYKDDPMYHVTLCGRSICTGVRTVLMRKLQKLSPRHRWFEELNTAYLDAVRHCVHASEEEAAAAVAAIKKIWPDAPARYERGDCPMYRNRREERPKEGSN